MRASTKILLFLNKFFKPQVHPFNLRNDGEMSYAFWQFQKGEDTVRFFLQKYTLLEMFQNKNVLDMGCGAGGKSLYYASKGAKTVVGADIIPEYEKEANDLAKKLSLEGKFKYVLADASSVNPGILFDTIIMNDFMEHVDKPRETLENALKLLAPGGRIYINFPPYYHPFGAHLSDAVNIPFVHMFFSDKTLIEAYKYFVKDLPDGQDRIKFRFSVNEKGEEVISYINRMTIKRFKKILKELNISPVFYNEVPLRPFLTPFAKIFKEQLMKMVVCVIEKS